MADPIDAFDPFEPLTTDEAESNPSGPEGQGESSSSGGSSGSRKPSSSGRRWSVPASVPPRPMPRSASPPVGRTQAGARTPEQPPVEAPHAPVRQDGTPIATLRRIAVSELRAAMARLAERGHGIALDDRLDEDEPVLAVRFRPDRGPLATPKSAEADSARFELRLGFEGDLTGTSQRAAVASGAGPDGARDRTHVIALDVPPSLDGASSVLGRTALRALTPEWVAHRFLEFVAHVLERS